MGAMRSTSEPWLGKRCTALIAGVVGVWIVLAPARVEAVVEEGPAGASDGEPTVTIVQVDDHGRLTVRDQSGNVKTRFAERRLIVKYKGTKGFLPGSQELTDLGGGLSLVSTDLPVERAVDEYQRRSDVEYAEPDYIVRVAAIPNDPLYPNQWGPKKIQSEQAWDLQTNASDVVVAVVDTGILYTHPDLQVNLWTGPQGEHGYNCITTTSTCVPGGLDDHGHGTHVAGTIGAVTNNAVGVAGLNWTVQLMGIKFLNSQGSGYNSDAVKAFNTLIQLKQSGVNIRVTNNSWGCQGCYSQALKDAMAAAQAVGIIHAVAAGNSFANSDASPFYPADYANVGIVSVLASDFNDMAASFTNYGLATVDLAAPGVSILSSVPSTNCWPTICDPSGYKNLSGTSMASPHVAGVLAAMLHVNPNVGVRRARTVILDPASSDPLTDPKATLTSTGRRLNFYKAITNPLLFSGPLNRFPTLTVNTAPVTVSGGGQVNIPASATDPDNDPLRFAWGRKPVNSSSWLTGWLLGTMLDLTFDPHDFINGNALSFTAPHLARLVYSDYRVGVADGRGGSALAGPVTVSILPSSTIGQPPTGIFSVTPTNVASGEDLTIQYPLIDPEGQVVRWSWTNGGTGSGCRFSPTQSSVVNSQNMSPGAYRFRGKAFDAQLNEVNSNDVVVRIGTTVGQPPVAVLHLSATSGPAPLTVTANLSASYDPDGTIVSRTIGCYGFGGGHNSPYDCVYTIPGIYLILGRVKDNANPPNWDAVEQYVVVTP